MNFSLPSYRLMALILFPMAGLFAVGCSQSETDEKSLPTASISAESPATESKSDSTAPRLAKPQPQAPLQGKPQDMQLIPRQVLFGNPDRAGLQLSPDGKWLSFLAPLKGVLNVWVAPIDNLEAAEAVTQDTHRGVRSYAWTHTNRHLLYSQDHDGDENFRVYCVDLQSKDIRDITPQAKKDDDKQAATKTESFPGKSKGAPVRAQIQGISHRFPEEILVGVNDRDPRWHDLYRVNLLTGDHQLIQQNDGYRSFTVDEDFNVRFATKYQPNGSIQYYQPQGSRAGNQGYVQWAEFLTVPQEDTSNTSIAGFDKTGKSIFLIDSRSRDTGALTTVDLATGKQTVLAADARTDVGGIKVHPTENTVQSVSFYYERRERKVFDPEVAKDLELLKSKSLGEIGIGDVSLDDRQWIVVSLKDDGPTGYYHFNRDTKEVRFLFVHREDLLGQPLANMHSTVIPARDGLQMVSYYTLPNDRDADGDGKASAPGPMVLLVHGGPWSRTQWGYNAQHQLLANRGYAVLSVNFRGSTGFGKNFINAGNKEWYGKMHDDLLDAVEWAVDQGIADRDKIAIMGGSYGGYATLVGLTKTPDVFACGVDIVGPSNLVTLLNTIPPYWTSGLQMFKNRVGDHTTPEGRAELHKRSPLNFVDHIKRPLLIGQGANDQRVKQSEADQIVEAMQLIDIPVTYVLFGDEGHGFRRPENNMAFNAVTEDFLKKHLGGKAEPIGDAFKGSSIEIPAGGKDLLPLLETR